MILYSMYQFKQKAGGNRVNTAKVKMNIQNSTGCFLNESIKTAVLIKEGKVISTFSYGNNRINTELINLNIRQSENWVETNEYVYVMPDDTKGWNQPFAGLKHNTAVEYLPTAWKQRVVLIENFLA